MFVLGALYHTRVHHHRRRRPRYPFSRPQQCRRRSMLKRTHQRNPLAPFRTYLLARSPLHSPLLLASFAYPRPRPGRQQFHHQTDHSPSGVPKRPRPYPNASDSLMMPKRRTGTYWTPQTRGKGQNGGEGMQRTYPHQVGPNALAARGRRAGST